MSGYFPMFILYQTRSSVWRHQSTKKWPNGIDVASLYQPIKNEQELIWRQNRPISQTSFGDLNKFYECSEALCLNPIYGYRTNCILCTLHLIPDVLLPQHFSRNLLKNSFLDKSIKESRYLVPLFSKKSMKSKFETWAKSKFFFVRDRNIVGNFSWKKFFHQISVQKYHLLTVCRWVVIFQTLVIQLERWKPVFLRNWVCP